MSTQILTCTPLSHGNWLATQNGRFATGASIEEAKRNLLMLKEGFLAEVSYKPVRTGRYDPQSGEVFEIGDL